MQFLSGLGLKVEGSSRYPISTLFPFSFWVLLVKAEQQEKGTLNY